MEKRLCHRWLRQLASMNEIMLPHRISITRLLRLFVNQLGRIAGWRLTVIQEIDSIHHLERLRFIFLRHIHESDVLYRCHQYMYREQITRSGFGYWVTLCRYPSTSCTMISDSFWLVPIIRFVYPVFSLIVKMLLVLLLFLGNTCITASSSPIRRLLPEKEERVPFWYNVRAGSGMLRFRSGISPI